MFRLHVSLGKVKTREWAYSMPQLSRSSSSKRQVWSSPENKEPWLGHQGSTLSKKESCSACARSRGYPLLDLVRVPRHSAGSKPYPRGELAGGLQPGDVREAVRNAIVCFQSLLRYELPSHCKSLSVDRELQPRLPWAKANILANPLQFNVHIGAHSGAILVGRAWRARY